MNTFEMLNNKLKEDEEDLAYDRLKLDESFSNLVKEVEKTKNLLYDSNCKLEDISFTMTKDMIDDINLYKRRIIRLQSDIEFTELLMNNKDK